MSWITSDVVFAAVCFDQFAGAGVSPFSPWPSCSKPEHSFYSPHSAVVVFVWVNLLSQRGQPNPICCIPTTHLFLALCNPVGFLLLRDFLALCEENTATRAAVGAPCAPTEEAVRKAQAVHIPALDWDHTESSLWYREGQKNNHPFTFSPQLL